MDWNFGWDAPLGVFGFVILIILIGGFFSWMKTRAVQATIREAIRAGTPLDPAVIRELRGDGEGAGGGVSRGLTGLILIAVAIALVGFGYMGSTLGDEPNALLFFASVAAFPGLIGVAFLIASRGGPKNG